MIVRVAVGVFMATRDIAQILSSGCSYGGDCTSAGGCARRDGCTRGQVNEFVVVGIRVSVGVLAVVCAFGDMWLRVRAARIKDGDVRFVI